MASVSDVAGDAAVAEGGGGGADGGAPVAVPVATTCVGGGALLTCTYTVAAEAAGEAEGGRSDVVVALDVQVLGQPVLQSPFAVVVAGKARGSDWRFQTVGPTLTLTEGGRRATNTAAGDYPGAIADGPGGAPMTAGRHYWEVQRVVHGDSKGAFLFGVCRPGTPVAGETGGFHNLAETWLALHWDNSNWHLYCKSCKGTGCTDKRNMTEDERVGLLLDLDGGGTLTIYRNNAPCGTIAVGLVGPLLPCVSAYFPNTAVQIHGNLEPPA